MLANVPAQGAWMLQSVVGLAAEASIITASWIMCHDRLGIARGETSLGMLGNARRLLLRDGRLSTGRFLACGQRCKGPGKEGRMIILMSKSTLRRFLQMLAT